ncbi:MAG: EamA family transporter, partial [Candidatus Levybacteria bacterium]|nr:EamA family transporter [Candidatus Levybacteria bacterium]
MWIGLLGLFVVGMLGGFTPVMIKFGVREFPPLLLTTLRFLVASIVFYPFFFRYQRN